jgi:hypothetical protein
MATPGHLANDLFFAGFTFTYLKYACNGSGRSMGNNYTFSPLFTEPQFPGLLGPSFYSSKVILLKIKLAF